MFAFRSKGPRFDPRAGHGDFSRVRDKWRPPLIIKSALSFISSDSCSSEFEDEFNMDGENVTGYMLGISYTCTALRYKPAFIATS